MALLDFTSYDDIRAALGVSSEEIEDTTLSLPLYEFNLSLELDAISLTLVADFMALPEPTETAAQKRFAETVMLFATYAVALQLTVSLPLFSPKEIGDGKAHMTRYAQDPYKATIEAVQGKYNTMLAALTAAYAALNATTAAAPTFRRYFAVVPSGSDPVTGT